MEENTNNSYRYFKLSEFDSPDLKGSGKYMSHKFVALLDKAREMTGIPFKINSGFRTPEHTEVLKKRGYKVAKKSSHLIGLAADIHCNNSHSRTKIVCTLVKLGVTRIGIANTFIHCDIDTNKNSAIWLY